MSIEIIEYLLEEMNELLKKARYYYENMGEEAAIGYEAEANGMRRVLNAAAEEIEKKLVFDRGTMEWIIE